MRAVFLDTSGLFAAARQGAARHAACRHGLDVLLRGGFRLVTTELIVAELHALASRRVGPDSALVLIRGVVSSPRIDVLPADRSHREAGLEVLAARPGRRYSLADAVSFVVMRDQEIDTAFTLDSDFAAEGFAVLPGP